MLKLVALASTAGLAAARAAAPTPGEVSASVYLSGDSFDVKFGTGQDPDAVVTGFLSPAADHASGFAVLELQGNSAHNASTQYYAAGYLEGALTAGGDGSLPNAGFAHYSNMMCELECNGTMPAPVGQFFRDQHQNMADRVAANPDDAFWRYEGALQQQFQGLFDGYHAVAPAAEAIEWEWMLATASEGDLFDIVPVVTDSLPTWDGMSVPDIRAELLKQGHCSSLIQLSPAMDDVFQAHSSWFTYSAMTRMFKTYHLDTAEELGTATTTQVFSSYPLTLSSLDDFYIMDSGLSMTQTTNGLYNTSAYEYLTADGQLSWERVRAANAFARTGEDWYNVVGAANGGSYVNQYMVLDRKLFVPGQALQPGLLWVVEQMPGLTEGYDMTSTLERGYWPSYNVPALPKNYEAQGYLQLDAKNGDVPDTSYQMAPRAEIFRRDHQVANFSGFEALMRANAYGTDDPLAPSPWNAICSRGDLASPGGSADGCYDTKASALADLQALRAYVVNGPTTDGGRLEPFSWAGAYSDSPHAGMPDVFDFEFEAMEPRWA